MPCLAYRAVGFAVSLASFKIAYPSNLAYCLQAAVLKAAPLPDLTKLNGVNVGAGGLPLDDTLIGIDAHRGLPEGVGEWRRGGGGASQCCHGLACRAGQRANGLGCSCSSCVLGRQFR